jgi:hypothetical protein
MTDQELIVVGSVVQLKSGGPEMTVSEIIIREHDSILFNSII